MCVDQATGVCRRTGATAKYGWSCVRSAVERARTDVILLLIVECGVRMSIEDFRENMDAKEAMVEVLEQELNASMAVLHAM